jgi:DNA-binding transcriptional ArsR family regulator
MPTTDRSSGDRDPARLCCPASEVLEPGTGRTWVEDRPASAGTALVAYLRMSADTQPVRLPEEQVELAVEIFRMLADGTRVRLLWALLEAELSVTDLAAAAGKPGPAVSQHLAKLRMARLVRTRREGNQVFYRLENDHVARLVLDAIHNAEHATDAVPSHHRGAVPELKTERSR